MMIVQVHSTRYPDVGCLHQQHSEWFREHNKYLVRILHHARTALSPVCTKQTPIVAAYIREQHNNMYHVVPYLVQPSGFATTARHRITRCEIKENRTKGRPTKRSIHHKPVLCCASRMSYTTMVRNYRQRRCHKKRHHIPNTRAASRYIQLI